MPDRILGTIFFGGGTPSLMPPETVGAIIAEARKLWRCRNDMEITLEANPTSAEAGKFRALKDAGVTRVSVGVQASDDASLRALGRLHTINEAWHAVELAQRIFDRSSFDLIYARQNQTTDDWRQELRQAIDRAAGHMSLYQLTIEPDTAFGDRFARGRLPGLPSDDVSADMYLLTQELCEAAGLNAYEVSNHAENGHEARHNLLYWEGGDYGGIGPGAHGRLTLDGSRIATEAIREPGAWMKAVCETGSGDERSGALSPHEASVESVMMGLRLRRGLPRERLRRLAPETLNRLALDQLIDEGFVVDGANGGLRLTETGRPLVNAVLNRLLN